MKSRRKQFESRAGAFAFRTIQRWISKGDALRAERIGERLGKIAYRLGKSRRERAVSNLEIAFPNMSAAERRKTAEAVFVHFGRVMCDFVRTAKRSKEEVLSSITVDGLHHLDEALAKGKGVIVVTGHFGNWERLAHWLAASGYPLSVVVRDANDAGLNDMVLDMRRAAGVGVISRGSAARAVLTKLRKNEIVGLLPDQNTAETFLPFFGKPCGTTLGPAVLAQRAGATIVPIYCYRTGPAKYHFQTCAPLEPVGGYEEPAEGMMVAVNRSLESMIREHPEQYLWIHDRWKAARREGLL